MFELNSYNKPKIIINKNFQKLIILYKLSLYYKRQQQQKRIIRNYFINKNILRLSNLNDINKQTTYSIIEVNTDSISNKDYVDDTADDDEIIDNIDNSYIFDYITHVEPTFDLIDIYDVPCEIPDKPAHLCY